MKIVDIKGEWFVNRAQFPFHDPISNTRFEPGVPTKATVTPWVKVQSVLEAYVVDETPTPQAEKPVEKEPVKRGPKPKAE